MNSIAWVLLVATHAYYGVNVSMQEFADKPACEHAASAVRQMTVDAGSYGAHTWCVPKSSQEPK